MSGAVTSLVSVALVLAASEPPSASRQPGQGSDFPALDREVTQSLGHGESQDWHIDLAAAEFLEIAVEPFAMGESDHYPEVTVTAPDGAVSFAATEPSLATSTNGYVRTVVSFVTERPGNYRLRVAGRGSPTRYRLRLEKRRAMVDRDRQRIAIYMMWREAMRLNTQGSRESLRASVQRFEETLPLLAAIEDDEGQALALGAIASTWYELADAKPGAAASTRALEIWRRLGRGREEGVALSDLGLFAYIAYDRKTARSYYDQALIQHRAAGDVLAEAMTLTRIGWLHYADAELQKVIDINQEALGLYRKAGDPTGESIAFNDLGRGYLDLGEVSQALDAYQKALALRPPDRYARGAANVLLRMGLVYLSVAEWQRALDALHQALTLARVGGDVRNETATLVNLGSAYITFGDTTEGARYLETALRRARSIQYGGAEGNALLWLGVGASLDGELEQARDYLQQSIAVLSAIKDVRGQAMVVRKLAAVQLQLGSAQDALASITKGIESFPQASGRIYTGVLTLASVYAALGDTSKATAHFEEALTRFREFRARNAEAEALTLFGRFQARRGLYAEARALLGQALDIQDSLRGRIIDPDLRMSYTSRSFTPYQLQVDVLMELERRTPGAGFAAAAFDANERARARGLLDRLATSGVDIREGVDPALVERERSLRWNINAKAALQTTVLAGKRDQQRLDALDRDIADLSSALRETTTRIRQESPMYASFTEPQPLTTADVGRLIGSDTVLLEYALGENQAWLFAVTGTSFEGFALSSRQAIETAARDVHQLLTARQPVSGESIEDRMARVERAEADLAARSQRLSDLVLGPVRARLDGEWRGKRLAIVAAGALEYVPFGALPLPGGTPERNPGFLVTAHEIVSLPSVSSLAALRSDRGRRPAAPKTLAVVADPVFATDDPRVKTVARGGRGASPERELAAVRSSASLESVGPDEKPPASFELGDLRASLARLPFSRAEAVAVAAQVPRESSLQAMDFDARLELATSGRLSDYRIVHFATHGFINTTRPELSGLALSLVDASGRSRDGYLRLNTIYNMRLSADLVVLSACQTALGKEVAGEGLVGLTRGFMYAGARRVIASLWQVSDVATAELMKKLYVGMLQHKLPPAAALRGAQLEMARKPRWASPYFWAGFVLQGDWQ